MADDNRIIEGFEFATAREAFLAREDYKKIQKIKNKIDLDDLASMIKLYNKLIEKKYFDTIIGITFMYEIRDHILSRTDYALKPIPLPPPKTVDINKSSMYYIDQINTLKNENEKITLKSKKLVITIVALITIVVGMIFIVATNENVGYFNAEEKVLNKYSSWEERLSNWEKELNEREYRLSE